MKRLRTALLVFVACLVSSVSLSNAASVYDARATAVLSLSVSDIDDLGYGGSSVSYSAKAVAKSNGAADVKEDTGKIDKNAAAGAFTENGNLGNLLIVPSDPDDKFKPGKVVATSGGAEATADSSKSSFPAEGNTATFVAAANGKASDPVEFASSNDVWNVLIQFTNTSTETLTAVWTVQYFLSNSATADPRGTADSVTDLQVQGGDVVGGVLDRSTAVIKDANAACDPLPSDCDFGSNPPSRSGTITFNFVMAAGETKYINIRAEARGSATVVPIPATLPLLISALGIFGFFGWRRTQLAAF